MNKKLLIPLLAILCLLLSCNKKKKEGADMDLYKSPELKEMAMASYDTVMEFWTVDYDELWIETDFGRSHVIVCGPEDAQPLFLFPGLFADATMWYANAGALAKKYRVICPDQMTYGGKSQPAGKKIEDIKDYVHWFRQHLEYLGYTRAAVGGLSYGAWQALAMAREIPDAVAAVVMLDPSETFIKMDGGIAWRGFRDFVFFPNRRKYRRFFNWLGGGYSNKKADIWLEHMLDVIEYGAVGMFDVPQHRIYHAEDLLTVRMPVLIMAGGKPILYKNPATFAEAAAKALPHAQIDIIPGTGHSLNVEKSNEVNDRILQFLEVNY